MALLAAQSLVASNKSSIDEISVYLESLVGCLTSDQLEHGSPPRLWKIPNVLNSSQIICCFNPPSPSLVKLVVRICTKEYPRERRLSLTQLPEFKHLNLSRDIL